MKKKTRGAPKAHEHDPAARAHGIPDLARTAPGHTDLMVTPESIDAFLEANPPPAPVIPDPADLVKRLSKITARGSCTCNQKNHGVGWSGPVELSSHDPLCRYRLLAESAAVLMALIDFSAHPSFRDKP